MPKIFKENKLFLVTANITFIATWLYFTSLINIFSTSNDYPFYIYKLIELFKYLPPIWFTYYLWLGRINE